MTVAMRPRWSRLLLIGGLCAGLGTLTACNIARTAARFADPILEAGTLAFEAEADPLFAEQAAPSNLKLLEGLLLEAPNDRDLLTLATRGYATYAFGFLDPKVEMARIEDPSAVVTLERRMAEFYQRAYTYGLRALGHGLGEALEDPTADFTAALGRQKVRDVPALFWTAYSLGAMIQLDITDSDRLAQFPRVQAMMAKVLELDEAYYFGGAHLFFAAMYAQLPPGGGGDAEASHAHFRRARELTGGRLLMIDVLDARYLAVRLQDYERYRTALGRVLATPASIEPAARLANELARQRASFYLDNADAFFLDIPAEGSNPAADIAPQGAEEDAASEELP